MERWFRSRGWEPFPFQIEAWRAYCDGGSGLIHAPTGMGKSLAAWGGPIEEWAGASGATGERCGISRSLDKEGAQHRSPVLSQGVAQRRDADPAPLRVLWLTPLRALANDTAENLRQPIDDLQLPWTIEIRTGDTPQSVKARQRERLPTALITTPESLSILLAQKGCSERFRTLRAIVVDEWHELLGSKRGVQTELCLARLRTITADARIWGLSATIGNIDEAMRVLLGPDRAPHGVLIEGRDDKIIEVDTILPDTVENFPWSGHLGIALLPRVIERIERAASTLIFTNTRSQAEIWFQKILNARPDWLGAIAIHHGSLDQEVRIGVETLLRAGKLRAVVCTSSLDLGVDFSPVDQVIQIGSPKGIARMMQRAGRSGHQPGAVSTIVGVPTNALELVEFSAAREAAKRREIEAREPIDRPLDVLAQHLVTVALGDRFTAPEMLREIRSTHSYARLTDDEWRWTLDFVMRGGPTLTAYPQYAKVIERDGLHIVESRQIARLHRMSIGTITSDMMMRVKLARGGFLGTIEESFIARLRPGDRFVFAGRVLELLRVRDMTATVRPARSRSTNVPRWDGGRSPLSTQLAHALRRKFSEVMASRADGDVPVDRELQLIAPLFDIQRAWSRVPQHDELLIERCRVGPANHIFIFSFAGWLVHEGLGALIAHRITRERPCTLHIGSNDYGFEIASRVPLEFDENDWRRLLSPENLVDDLLECVNGSQLARRRFRDIARIAGLIFTGYPGEPKTARQLQASSNLFFDVFTEFDPENLLLDQARREVLDRELELVRMRSVLERLTRERMTIIDTPRLTPLSFPLWVEQMRSQQMSSESVRDRIERMMRELEDAAARTVTGGSARSQRAAAVETSTAEVARC